MELVYRLFAEIDRIVYLLVSQILLLIDNLSKYNFFSADTIRNFTDKVYVIVGVLMLFKLVISAIQYIINPDSFSDKNKGLSSILTKSIISVGLIVLVPEIFKFAMEVQNDIVEAIPRVVFGSSGITGNSSEINEIGESIASTTLDSFLQPKEGRSPTKTVTSVGVGNFPEAALDGCNANFFSAEFWSGANCNYNYTFLISTIVGGFLVFILVSMAIDIGIRTIKLGIVQILAPIPIVSYISDEKKFNNWVQTSLQIYADLFIRMAIIYLVIYFMRVMLKDFFTTSGYPEDFATAIGRTPGIMEIAWVKIFIIIALLLFAKNAPKFITDLLGIKGVDDSITNMFKRAGGMFGATTGGLRDMISGGVNRYNKIKEDPKYKGHKGKQITAALKTAAMTGRASVWSGTKAAIGGKGYKDVRGISKNAANRAFDLREARRDADVGWLQYQKEVVKNRMGIRQQLDAANAEIKAAQESSDKSKAALDYVHNNMGAKFSTLKFDADFINRNGGPAKQFVVGYDHSTGTEIKVNMSDMNNLTGRYSINTILNQLKSTVEDKDGKLAGMGLKGQEIKSKAEAALDELQGLADSFTVSTSVRNASYKASVGYKDNPAFDRIVQEAVTTIVTNSSSQFGVEQKALGDASHILDSSGNPKEGYLGDWLGQNKKEGQKKQKAGMQETLAQGSAAVAKQIADKYDNKK